jgi:hypothetical protein
MTHSYYNIVNKTTIKINVELKDIIRKIQKENNLYLDDYLELSKKYKNILNIIYDKIKFKRSKPNYFALSCLIFCDINCINGWEDVIKYINYNKIILETEYYETNNIINCCCSKNIQYVNILENKELKIRIIMGISCIDKYEILNCVEIKQIQKKQDIIKEQKKRIKEWRKKCVNCKVYGIIECKNLNYHIKN